MATRHELTQARLRASRLQYIWELLKQNGLTVEDLAEFGAGYRSRKDVMLEHRKRTICAKRNAESLEKARAARAAKRAEVKNV